MVNSGWLTSYVLKCMGQSIWNQRHVCIEFVINNISPQGNVKITLNLKVEEIFRDCSANFLWNNWQLTKILLSHIRHGVAGKPPPLIFSKTTKYFYQKITICYYQVLCLLSNNKMTRRKNLSKNRQNISGPGSFTKKDEIERHVQTLRLT